MCAQSRSSFFLEVLGMRFRLLTLPLLAVVLVLGLFGAAPAQGGGTQSDLSAVQRLDVMRSKLDALRRSLSSGIAGIPQKPAADKGKNKANADDPRVRLQGLDKEASSILSEVNDIHAKADRSERYDATRLDGLETSVKELEARVQTALTETASARTGNDAAVASTAPHRQRKKGHLFGLIGRGGGNSKVEELTSNAAPGRDRVLFEEAAKEVRKGNHDTGRLLFTTIITTYPDSPFLPLAKLAIADSFYLEGGTSSLIQAAASYQDWLAFFPTDPLADAAMLKVAESEMRQMGLSDRDITHARKAEQRLKVLLQQYPQSKLRPTVQDRLWEVQESLGMHSMSIGDFYLEARYKQTRLGLKGAQSRYKEVVDKYPCFSQTDKVLFKLAYTYAQEEEPDEAAKYYVELLQKYPDSEYAEKAKEQLSIIGVPIPEKGTPNTCPKRDRPSFIGNLMQQVAGSADVTVGKDGILISRNSKEGDDLIDQALKYNGTLPSNTMPKPQVQRSKQPVTPANDEQTAPEKKKIPLTIQATPNGPVPSPINPSAPTSPTGRPPGTQP
jgi:outer membrane protein assembly factor BamD